MDDNNRWKKLLPWAIGGVIVLLILRSRSTGAGQASTAAGDPLQQAAQQMQIQNAQAANARQQALQTLQFQEAAQAQQVNFYQQLSRDPFVACPGGGLPRYVPGQGFGCVQKTASGNIFTQLLNLAQGAAGVARSV